jgi:hypothetical protein
LLTCEKPKVEVAVQVVERWIMARLRHHRFASVHSVNEAIGPLLRNLNERPFQKLPGCRASAFAELDAPALQSLPAQPYELARFKTVTVPPRVRILVAPIESMNRGR